MGGDWEGFWVLSGLFQKHFLLEGYVLLHIDISSHELDVYKARISWEWFRTRD